MKKMPNAPKDFTSQNRITDHHLRKFYTSYTSSNYTHLVAQLFPAQPANEQRRRQNTVYLYKTKFGETEVKQGTSENNPITSVHLQQ